MQSGSRISSVIRVGSAMALMGLAAAVVVGECYIHSGSNLCCNSYDTPCGEEGNLWTCPQTRTAGGGAFTVKLVTTTPTGGKTGFASTTLGTCTMSYTSCGPTAGDCTSTGSTLLVCRNTVPAGGNCGGGGGGR